MSTKVQKRLDTIEKDVSRLHELLSEKKYHKGSVMQDMHTMVMNTDFLLYNVKSMGEAQQTTHEQHQKQMQPLYTEVNIQGSFIKSKGLHEEYPLYRKDLIEKQQKAAEEAEAKAKAEIAKPTEGPDGAAGEDTPPGSKGNSGK